MGDILLKIGSYEIKNMTDLFAALSKLSIGEEATLSILRMGRRYEASLRLVEGPVEIMRRIKR